MSGYANRVVHITFPELTETPDDSIWISMRNPRMVPENELASRNVAMGPDGKPVDMGEATKAMHVTFAHLILGWRVYDASVNGIDEATGKPLDQPLLPHPPTPESVAKLPNAIITRLAQEFKTAVNP